MIWIARAGLYWKHPTAHTSKQNHWKSKQSFVWTLLESPCKYFSLCVFDSLCIFFIYLCTQLQTHSVDIHIKQHFIFYPLVPLVFCCLCMSVFVWVCMSVFFSVALLSLYPLCVYVFFCRVSIVDFIDLACNM